MTQHTLLIQLHGNIYGNRLSEYGGSIVQYSIYAHSGCVLEYYQIIDMKVGLQSNYNVSNMCINLIA